MTPTATRPPGRLMLLIVAAVIWGLDQLTKMIAVQNMALGEVIAPIPALAPYFTFTHTTNTGAAFGLFPDAGWIFVVVAVVVIAAILFYYDQLPTHHLLVRVALGLQLGGAVGNLTDRLTRGAVVDFLDFKVWPVFNIADSSIVVGVAILAYYLLQDDHTRTQSTVQPSPSSPGGSEGRGES